jgi:hypothetical protein
VIDTARPRIPEVIYQTFPATQLPPALEALADQTRRANPTWRYEYYDDDRVEEFVRRVYGLTMLKRYLRIDPRYGAARADLFRYLLIYHYGGLYLDSKSLASAALSDGVRADDDLLLGRWSNGPGDEHAGFGMHKDIAEVSGGEFQQWWLAAAPGSAPMGHVVEQVCRNLDTYNPWRSNVGRPGVLRVTGPIAFTRAMVTATDHNRHRVVDAQRDLGLMYDPLTRFVRLSVRVGYGNSQTTRSPPVRRHIRPHFI